VVREGTGATNSCHGSGHRSTCGEIARANQEACRRVQLYRRSLDCNPDAAEAHLRLGIVLGGVEAKRGSFARVASRCRVSIPRIRLRTTYRLALLYTDARTRRRWHRRNTTPSRGFGKLRRSPDFMWLAAFAGATLRVRTLWLPVKSPSPGPEACASCHRAEYERKRTLTISRRCPGSPRARFTRWRALRRSPRYPT